MNYIKSLDFLRAVAVFIVVFHHLPIIENAGLFSFVFHGITGVDIFFILSGFLITSILLNAKTSNKPNSAILYSFYVRRFLRIFPIYYLTIIFLIFINPDNYRAIAIYDLTYTSNIYMGLMNQFTSITPHFWSLAVEEQFYLIWPLILLFTNKKYILHSIIVVFSVGVFYWFFSLEQSFFAARTFNNLIYLASGGIWSYFFLKIDRVKIWLSKISGIYIVSFIVFEIFCYIFKMKVNNEINFWICFLFSFLLVVRFSIPFQLKFLNLLVENPITTYLGKISYGIYLFHFLMIIPLAFLMAKLNPNSGLTFYEMNALKIVLCILVSSLSWVLFEKPILKLKNRFKYT